MDGEQSAGYVLIACCENKECLALLMQVGTLQRTKVVFQATVNTECVSGVIFNSNDSSKQ